MNMYFYNFKADTKKDKDSYIIQQAHGTWTKSCEHTAILYS